MYKKLSSQWYDLLNPHPPREEYVFFLEYIKKSCGPVLEPMCGSGRFLIPYLQLGYEVHGFDISEFMMKELSDRLDNLGLEAKVWLGGFDLLPSEPIYDFVFIPSGSFALITDLDEARRCLFRLQKSMKKGAKAVFEMETNFATPPDYEPFCRGELFRGDGFKIRMTTTPFPVVDSIARVACLFELIDGSDVVEREYEDFAIRLYSQDEFEAFLKGVGFVDLKRLKAFDITQRPSPSDEIVVFEATIP